MRNIHMWRQRRDEQGEQGAAAVEFALVLPLLLALLFGIIAYGIVFAQSLSLSNAARQAARAAVISGATCAQVTSLARDNASTIALNGADVDVLVQVGTASSKSSTCNPGGNLCAGQADGTNIYVVLSYATSKSGLSLPFVPVPATLSQTGAFRCEL